MRRAVALIGALLALTAGLAIGCGGDDSSGSSNGGAAGTGSAGPQGAPQGMKDFQACLQEHGAELPSPGSGGAAPPTGGTPPTGAAPGGMSGDAAKAFRACRDQLPQGGFGPPQQ